LNVSYGNKVEICDSEQRPMAGCCEYGKGILGSITGVEFLVLLIDSYLLKTGSALWISLVGWLVGWLVS